MKTQHLVVLSTLLMTTVGCSKDYTPQAGATGEQTYQAVCADCHQKDTQGQLFVFSKANANTTYIAERVHNGNLRMPKFPNIQGDELKKLTNYILENSTTK